MQNRPEKCLMTFLVETKITVNPQILVISGKIRQDFLERKNSFSRLHKQSDKKVEKV